MLKATDYKNGKVSWNYKLATDIKVTELQFDDLKSLVGSRYLNNEHCSLFNNLKYNRSNATIETLIQIAIQNNVSILGLVDLMLNTSGKHDHGKWFPIEGNTGSGKIDRRSRVILKFLKELHRINPKLVNITII